MIRILFTCLLLLYTTDAAKILAVIPTASFSHQVFYQPLWKELAVRGHEVTLVTTDLIKDFNNTNLRQVDISIAYEHQTNLSKDLMSTFLETDKITAFQMINEVQFKITEVVYSHKGIKDLFKDKTLKYDLLMLECVFVGSYTFMHRFKAPTICLTSLDAYHETHAAMGNPTHQILYPYYMLPFSEPLNFFERVMALTSMTMMTAYVDYYIVPRMHKILSASLEEEFPYPTEVALDFDMLFTNSNPLFGAVRPFTPATISLSGGLHQTTPKPLPKDLRDFLDSATDGAIYFSLGSNVKSKNISPATRKAIIEAFSQLTKYKVLWKFEDDEMPDKPSNVKISKWVPQQDVLRHKNVKVFITQAGVQSLEEALYARVPMIAIPYFGDQDANAKRLEQKGLGLCLDHHTLTAEQFKQALLEVMLNEQFRERIGKVADIVADQPMKPLDKAVWWTEYVLRHKGAKHLQGPKIPAWQFYYLDVIGFIFAIVGIITFSAYKTFKMLYTCMCKKQKSKTD